MRSVIVVVVAAVLAAAAGPAWAADGQVELTRYGGDNRYATAASLALARFSSSSDVLLARGDDPTDGLTANYPAGGHSAPVLLAEHDRVPPVVLDAMRRLLVRTIHLMGGQSALSASLERDLRAAGYQVDRYAGRDRYETAALAAESNGIGNAGRPDLPVRTALLAAGDRPTDALVTGPLAWSSWPLLLTRRDDVPAATLDVLRRYEIRHVVIVGGAEAVGPNVEAKLRSLGLTIERIEGPTREATATAFADFLRTIGWRSDRVGVASSSATADALALGAHVAPDGPVLLCHAVDDCGAVTLGWIAARADEIDRVVVAGGNGVIGVAAETQLRQAAG